MDRDRLKNHAEGGAAQGRSSAQEVETRPRTFRLFLSSLWSRLWPLVFWLFVWYLLRLKLADYPLFAGPGEVFKRVGELLLMPDTWLRTAKTLARVLGGWAAALIAGPLLAWVSFKLKPLRRLLSWPLLLIRTVPVAVLIIVLLIWLPSARISPIISAFMALPLFYQNTLSGLESQSRELDEMAEVFCFSRRDRLLKVTLPQVQPYFTAAARTALSLSFKAGIAAEVIGLPALSIGEMLYESKILLDTRDLFAWAILIMLLSLLAEKVLLLNPRRVLAGLRGPVPAPPAPAPLSQQELDRLCTRLSRKGGSLELRELDKRYGSLQVLRDLSLVLQPGEKMAVVGPSGIGKTTLLRLAAGLEAPDAGYLGGPSPRPLGLLFQEDRLLEQLSALDNLMPVLQGEREEARQTGVLLLRALELPAEDRRPVSQYSGGMKRRVALARALAADSSLVLLDEPFKGLDPDLKTRLLAVCRQLLAAKTVMLITHEVREAEGLGIARHLRLASSEGE